MTKVSLPVLAYSVRELAVAASVSEATIWKELSDGELESALIGDRRLITPQQAERWLKRKAARAKAVREQRQLELFEKPPELVGREVAVKSGRREVVRQPRAKARDRRQLELIDE